MNSVSLNSLNFKQNYTPKEAKTKLCNNAAKENSENNILHKAPLRYAGYFDDIGAATRVVCANSKNALVKNLPAFSYIPAGIYIGADVGNTFMQAKKTDGTKIAAKKAAREAIFQTITSILFPIAIIGTTQKAAGKGFDKFIPSLKQQFDANGAKILNRKRDIALVTAGLGTLFGLSKTTDKFTDKILMEKIIDPALGLHNDIQNHSKTGKTITSKLSTTQG